MEFMGLINQFVLIIFSAVYSISCNDVFMRDFRLFAKPLCKFGCSRIQCYPGTLISIETVTAQSQSPSQLCLDKDRPPQSPGVNYPHLPYDISSNLPLATSHQCPFKFIQNHVFKSCSNSYNCDLCPDKIRLQALPNQLCSSDHDLLVQYRCLPKTIKTDNVCVNSYLDIDCFSQINEVLVITNATIYSRRNRASSFSNIGDGSSSSLLAANRLCRTNGASETNGNEGDDTEGRIRCVEEDVSMKASAKCSYRTKCSIGPHRFSSPQCQGSMHLQVSHACVPKIVLRDHQDDSKFYNHKNIKSQITPNSINSDSSTQTHSSSSNRRWIILGICAGSMLALVLLVILPLAICITHNRRRHTHHSCHINPPVSSSNSAQKYPHHHHDPTSELNSSHTNTSSSLFYKLANFAPPPSSIDKVNLDFDRGVHLLHPPDIYDCNQNTNHIQYYPPSIDPRQYIMLDTSCSGGVLGGFSSLPAPTSHNQINYRLMNQSTIGGPIKQTQLLEMPSLLPASSSGNLSDSSSAGNTTNDLPHLATHLNGIHTPRGTKSSGIFSMQDINSFDNSHQV